MRKNKIVIVLLIIVILGCLSGGIFGLLNSKSKDNETTEYTVKILYYLDESQLLDKIPKNTEDEVLYRYDRYVCTNKVTGTWDNDKWTFTPNKTADSTCKVYFVSAMHQITLNISNGALDASAETLIDKGKDGTFKINPTEGHVFNACTCENQEEILWDEIKNELTVKNIQSDTTCEVLFALSEFEVELVVANGKGAIKKPAQYNAEFTSEVTASSGYGDPSIACTNKQTGTWENNQFKIANVKNNTKCTINFKSTQTTPTLYTVTLIISGNATYPGPTTVESGGSAYFNLTINDGYKIGSITDCNNATNNDRLITVANVVKNTTCNVNIIQN